MTLALTDVALAAVGMLGGIAEAQITKTERPSICNDLYGAYGTDFLTKDGRRVMVVAISPKQWKGLQEATQTTVCVLFLFYVFNRLGRMLYFPTAAPVFVLSESATLRT